MRWFAGCDLPRLSGSVLSRVEHLVRNNKDGEQPTRHQKLDLYRQTFNACDSNLMEPLWCQIGTNETLRVSTGWGCLMFLKKHWERERPAPHDWFCGPKCLISHLLLRQEKRAIIGFTCTSKLEHICHSIGVKPPPLH